MTKEVIYKITKQKYEIIEVNTPEEEKIIEELNRDFERTEKANQRFRTRFLSLDELYETQGFELADDLQSDDEDKEEKERFNQKLHTAIASLTPRQKEIIMLHYFQDKSQVEIAEILHIDKSTVSITLERAHSNLRKYFEKN